MLDLHVYTHTCIHIPIYGNTHTCNHHVYVLTWPKVFITTYYALKYDYKHVCWKKLSKWRHINKKKVCLLVSAVSHHNAGISSVGFSRSQFRKQIPVIDLWCLILEECELLSFNWLFSIISNSNIWIKMWWRGCYKTSDQTLCSDSRWTKFAESIIIMCLTLKSWDAFPP